jgi:hypothetical protein
MKRFLYFGALLHASLFAQNPGDNFFHSNIVHTIEISFSQTNFWDSLTYYYESDTSDEGYYMLADKVEIDGQVVYDVGIRLKGNSSYLAYPGDKKSLKIDFDEYVSGQKLDGLKKLNLNNCYNDPTFLREKLVLDYAKKNNLYAPRCTFTQLYINNILWGLYTVVEQVNATFLKSNFSNNDGNLFKGDPSAALSWKGSNQSNYYNFYELKTNEDVNDWSGLVHLIDNINNETATAFQDSLAVVLDINSFLACWALNNIFVNLDTYFSMAHNYYIYHDTSGQFRWIIWDTNGSFGVFNQQGLTMQELEQLSLNYIRPPAQNYPLCDNILKNTNLSKLYLDHAYSILNNNLDTSLLYYKIDSLANIIRPYVYADTKKMFSDQQFEDNLEYTPVASNMQKQIPALKEFIKNRLAYLHQLMLDSGYVISEVKESKTQNEQIHIFPNPIDCNKFPGFKMFSNEEGRLEMEVRNTLGGLVKKQTFHLNPGNNTNYIDIRNVSRGLYLINFIGKDGYKIEQIVIY